MDPTHFLGPLAVWHHPARVQERARILLVHGISEHSGRHSHTVDYFVQRGISVIRFDLRGMGRSGGRRQWIERFNDYVEDVSHVFNWIGRVLPNDRPLFLLGHSLGGAIAIHFASAYSALLQGLILNGAGYKLGRFVSPLTISLGKAVSRFAPELPLPKTEIGEGLSRDPAVKSAYINDPLCCHFNTLGQGAEVLKGFSVLPEKCAQIRCPVILTHGTDDSVIDPTGSFELVRAFSGTSKELHFLPGGYHETHNDIDREHYFALLSLWTERVLK